MSKGLIEKAIEVAVREHWHQKSKGSDIPYITHPIAVGLILAREGYQDGLIAAGILHDTLEDTGLTFERLSAEFGKDVAEIVAGCSEPDKSLSWERCKEHTVEFLATAPLDIRVVACADKLNNIRRIASDYREFGDAVWSRFKRGREKQEWYYRTVAEVLCPSGDDDCEEPIFNTYRREVDMFFSLIPESAE